MRPLTKEELEVCRNCKKEEGTTISTTSKKGVTYLWCRACTREAQRKYVNNPNGRERSKRINKWLVLNKQLGDVK